DDLSGFVDSYLFGTLSGGAVVNNEFMAGLEGSFLSEESLGVFEAALLGVYSPTTSTWYAEHGGIFSHQTELTSSGDFYTAFMRGLMGLTDSPWDGSTH